MRIREVIFNLLVSIVLSFLFFSLSIMTNLQKPLKLEQFSTECRKYFAFAFVLFYYVPWLVEITSAIFSTNQI